MKPALLNFTLDGSDVSEIVGEISYYQRDISKFLKDVNFEFGYLRDELFKEEDVKYDYIKWYDNPENAGVAPLELFEDGCYSFCDENDKDAEKVFYIDLKDDSDG